MVYAPGTFQFTILAPMWQPDAEVSYVLGLPQDSMIHSKLVQQKDADGTVHRNYELTWPRDAVVAKTFNVPMKAGVPLTAIETQLLHFDGDAWSAYTYRWNDDGNDAALVASGGDTREWVTWEGKHRFLGVEGPLLFACQLRTLPSPECGRRGEHDAECGSASGEDERYWCYSATGRLGFGPSETDRSGQSVEFRDLCAAGKDGCWSHAVGRAA
jgi:hypothetical protein